MEIGILSFDFNTIIDIFSQPAPVMVLQLFALVGWLILVYLLLLAGMKWYAGYYIQGKNTSKWKFTLLAVDIPQLNVQTPLAVEQMFSHLAGAFSKPDLRAKFREGYKQRWFSFEIISIEGYIQFLVWTEQTYRDLVEASIYAQYPEAEITEVEDYTGEIPEKFPNDTYDMWAGDFVLAENNAYPIRTYREFEHNISKDTVLKDPMGTFLESFTRIGHGERMWFQILVEPIGNEWKEKAIKEIKKLIGEEEKHHNGFLSLLFDNPISKEIGMSLNEIRAQLTGVPQGEEEVKKEVKKDPNQLRYMTPGQVKLVEAMEEKISKIGFKTKMRGLYIAQKEVFNPVRGVNAMIGAINQYNIPTANSLVPKFTTFHRNKNRSNHRKVEFLKAYKKRKIIFGANPFILNIAELATIWHFPMSHVKTPLVQKAKAKTAEPPAGLPVEFIDYSEPTLKPVEEESKKTYKTDTGEEIKYEGF